MVQKNERRKYASDLSDSQWAVILPLLAPAGNKSKWEKRELIDAALYFVETGCKWRNLPHDFPPYTTVVNFYYAAIRSGLWEKIRAVLVERVRTDAGRDVEPSYAIIDSQSVKTAANMHNTKAGILVARDAFKKYPSIQRFCADAEYRKTFERDVSSELGLGVSSFF